MIVANDPSKISPVLLDRLTVINVEDFNIEDKIKIAQQYLIPDPEKIQNYLI